MRRSDLEAMLIGVRDGDTSIDEAVRTLAQGRVGTADSTVQDVAAKYDLIARLDSGRTSRCGFPEVIFGAAKSPADLAAIAIECLRHNDRLLITRADDARFEVVFRAVPLARYHERARCISVRPKSDISTPRRGVVVACAGTGDVPVAEEARVTAQMMGEDVEVRYDVGVAGLQRVLGELDALEAARVVIVVAGMDGALPSVVAGLVSAPVIAVPTSVGYGAAFEGVAPLLTMLNACAPGVSVVNIDNGFGAGYLAATINRMGHETPE